MTPADRIALGDALAFWIAVVAAVVAIGGLAVTLLGVVLR